MSIINDALKKARRQTPDPATESDDPENQPLKPKKRASSKAGPKQHYAGLILVVLFLGLVGTLGYVVYTEYLTEPESTDAAPEAKPTAAPKRANATSPDAEEAPEAGESGEKAPIATEEPANPSSAPSAGGEIRISSGQPTKSPSEPAPQPIDPEERPAVAEEESAPPTTQRPPASFLSRFSINGVMRSSAGNRILTNSGVYRIGDTLAAPSGYRITEINETEVILEGPEDQRYAVPLP